MDCRNIDTRLKQIRREANKLCTMLGGGNTGKEFHTALDVIEIHVQAIRAETGDRLAKAAQEVMAEIATESDKITLATRPGDYAVYENRSGVRYHIETSSQRSLYGVENVTEGVSLCPRTKQQVKRLIAQRNLVFVEIGR